MRAHLDTAGERLSIDCPLAWVSELIAEGSAGELERADAAAHLELFRRLAGG